MKNKTLYITTLGIFTALAFVFSLITISLGNIKITFASLPTSLLGYAFGPISGFICGSLSSFLDQMLKYGFTATTALWILPSGIRGMLCGYGFHMLRKNNESNLLLKFEIIGIISAIITTLLNTGVMYIDAKMYGYYTPIYLWGDFILRLITGIITAAIVNFIIYLCWNPIKPIIKNIKGA